MINDWRTDPASDIEKAKLAFFGCTWDDGITRGQATEAIKECVRLFPERELEYQNLPAGEEHSLILRSLGFSSEETGTFLTVVQADRLISELQGKRFTEEFLPIKRRIERSLIVTDDDFNAIEFLKEKYDIELTLQGNFSTFRSAFLIEVKGQLPPPISVAFMLNDGEAAYYRMPCAWHQVAPPSALAATKLLSDGFLYVTSERLLFSGDPKSVVVNLKKIVNCRPYSDFLKVEKTTGKSDLFSMNVAAARYIMALVRALKSPQARSAVHVVQPQSQVDTNLTRVRSEPATEKQKEKLRYFGYAFQERISKGEAHDALDQCAKQFPTSNQEYYNRPATEDQLKILRGLLEHFGDEEVPEDYAKDGKPLTYGQAKEAIRDLERAVQREDLDQWSSEDGLKDEAFGHLHLYYLEGKRELTPDEFDKVWDLAKSRQADKSAVPAESDLFDILVELFPEFEL